jgi:hypothetical protein
MPSWKKVILSGSDATLNSLYVEGPITGSDIQIDDWGSVSASLAAISSTGSSQTLQQVTDNGNTTTNSITAASFTGSLFGTASYASQALSSSYSLTATSASHALNANNAITASYVATASYIPTLDQVTTQGSTTTNDIEVGQLAATNVVTVDNGFAISGVFRTIGGQNSFILESSGSGGVNPGVVNLELRSYSGSQKEANIIYDGTDKLSFSNEAGSQFYLTGSNTDNRIYINNLANTGTGSIYIGVDPVVVRNGGNTPQFLGNANTATTASYALQALSSSYAITSTSASHALNADNAISSSHAIFADTASFLPSTTNLNITSISASTATFTSASIGYLQTISGSAKIIGDAFIILNNDTPTERYAGIKVVDSGSANVTASFLYDGQTDDWFYEYESGAPTDFGVVLFGPEYSTLGSPIYLTENRIPKATANKKHLNDSNLSDDGSRVSSAVPLTVTGSITGSDVQINAWGSISASLASIEAGVATQTLQDVTDNGNTTTNSIAVTGFTSSITGGDGITGTFRSTNGYNRLFLISTGSSGTNFGQVNIVLRDSSGTSNNDGTISYGGGQSATFSIKTANDNEIKLQGTTTDHVHSFSDGGTGSLVWNSVVPFIQRTGSDQTKFLGLATSASYASQALSSSFATSASYVASASYTPTLQQVLNSGNSATNSSLYLKGTWNNVLQIGNDTPTTAPLYAITASVGLGLHGTQIYWSGSLPDGSNYSAIVNKSVDQFQTDNDTVSVAGKLFVFSGLPIDEGFHSVHCDYVLMGVGVGGTSVTNVKAGTIIVAVDDSGNISYNDYSTTNTNGNISDVPFVVENVAGFIQCWISNTAGFNAVKSRVTFL